MFTFWWQEHKKKVTIVACVILAFLVLLAAFWVSRRINPWQVEKVLFVTHHGHGQAFELDEAETKHFIRLYNFGSVSRIPPEGETTPDYLVHVYFSDGSCMVLGDTCGKKYDFEVSYRDQNGKNTGRTLYADNNTLEEFLLTLADKYGQG